MTTITTVTYSYHFSGYFPRKPGLSGCQLDSQYPAILILTIYSQNKPKAPKLFVPIKNVTVTTASYPIRLLYKALKQQQFSLSKHFYISCH